MDSTELFRNSIDCVKGNIVKWRKEQQQQNFNTEVLHERIQESEKKLCLAEMKLELMNERKEIAENDLSILKEAFEKVYYAIFRFIMPYFSILYQISVYYIIFRYIMPYFSILYHISVYYTIFRYSMP